MNKEQHELVVAIKNSTIIKLSCKQTRHLKRAVVPAINLTPMFSFLWWYFSVQRSTPLYSPPCTTHVMKRHRCPDWCKEKASWCKRALQALACFFSLHPQSDPASRITRRRAGEGDLNPTKIGTDRKLSLPKTLAPIFYHKDQAIVPSFPWKPIFRALDPWLCPFSTPSHSCLKRHEKAHNEYNATLSTLTTLHWCFIIQVEKIRSCHILLSPRYHHSWPDIANTLVL